MERVVIKVHSLYDNSIHINGQATSESISNIVFRVSYKYWYNNEESSMVPYNCNQWDSNTSLVVIGLSRVMNMGLLILMAYDTQVMEYLYS